jgi:phage gp36-like protein
MGNYVSAAEVEQRLRKNFATLYTPRGLTASDATIVAADIAAAEADLHSYLAGRYAVPVTDVTARLVLKGWALTLVEELAYAAVPGLTLPESVTDRVKELRARLEKIAAGKLSLGTATDLDATGAGAEMMAESATPVFTRTTLRGF